MFAPADLGIRHLLIGAGKILAVSDNKDDLMVSAATEFDLQGRRLLPGFIDGHAHVTGGGGEAGWAASATGRRAGSAARVRRAVGPGRRAAGWRTS